MFSIALFKESKLQAACSAVGIFVKALKAWHMYRTVTSRHAAEKDFLCGLNLVS